jgi:hypothetical protein
VELSNPYFYAITDTTSCISDDDLRSAPEEMHAVTKNDRQEIDFPAVNNFDHSTILGPSIWTFYTTPLTANDKIVLSSSDALIFHLHITYTTATRDISVFLNISFDDGYRTDNHFRTTRTVTLPAGTTDTTVVCRLFSPGEGYMHFNFDFQDDSFGKTTKEFTLTADSQSK